MTKSITIALLYMPGVYKDLRKHIHFNVFKTQKNIFVYFDVKQWQQKGCEY